MSGAARAQAMALGVTATFAILSGCLADAGAQDAAQDCDKVVAGIRTTTSTSSSPSEDGLGRERPDHSAMDATETFVQDGAFCHVLANGEECGFELDVWADHHGFRVTGDPLGEHRSIERLEFDDGGQTAPFSLSRGAMGVLVFADHYVPTYEGDQPQPAKPASQGVRDFLRNVTTAPEPTIASWAAMVERSGFATIWEDPAWEGWSEYSSTDHPTYNGQAPQEPPRDLFRVAQLYADLTAGQTRPPVEGHMAHDIETWGPWTFDFSIDKVEAVRDGADAVDVLSVNAYDQVRYLRISQQNLDDAGVGTEIEDAFACLGLPAPGLDGVQQHHVPWPPSDEEDDGGPRLPTFSFEKDVGKRTLTVVHVDDGLTWGQFDVVGCRTPAAADTMDKGDVLSECKGTVTIAWKATGQRMFEATF